MSVESILKKDGINVIEKLDTLTVNSISRNIAAKLCSTFPDFGINQNQLFMKLCRLDMYYADMEEGMAEANYFYKNTSIYFNSNIPIDRLEEFAVHECIHYIQEVKDKKNFLLRMGLCDYSDFKIYGLGINEAAVQLMSSKVNKHPNESVKYFGVDFSTISPSYYPLECCLVNQLAYLLGEDILFKSTLFSTNDFNMKFAKMFSQKSALAIENAIDSILDKEEKIIKLNNKIIESSDDRNKKIDNMIEKINELKLDIQVTFLRTQNLIISSYFNIAFDNIKNLSEIDIYRKKLYSFRDFIGTSDGYTFFDDFYIEKVAALDHKATVIENGGMETAINIKIEDKENFIFILFRKIGALLSGKARSTEENRN